MTEHERQQIGALLWRRFADAKGELRRITHAQLDRLRSDIIAGRVPAFIPTDYEEAWYKLASDEVYRMFMIYRQSMARSSQQVRRFIPMVLQGRDHAIWIDGTHRRDEAVAYSRERMRTSIRSAILLHGAAMLAFGDSTWEEVRALAHGDVDEAIKDAAGEAAA